jgi:hypothetical protein
LGDYRSYFILCRRGLDFQAEEIGMTQESFASERQWLSARLAETLLVLFSLLEALIWLRVILKLMAANPANSFVRAIYQLSSIPVWPFSGLVNNPTGGGMVVEITSLIGMIAYCLLCWVIIKFLHHARANKEAWDVLEF